MRSLRRWIGAAMASIILNFVFFSLMPLMTNQDENIAMKSIPSTTRVNVVRLKKPDPEIIKPEVIKNNIKPEEKTNVNHNPRSILNPQPFLNRPMLDFEVSPNLPGTVLLPAFPMEQVEFSSHAMDRTYTAAEIDNSLTPIAHVPPLYPFQAKRRGIQGWVKVKFLVNIKGGVEQISILESDPEDFFEASVLNALPQWRFSPGTIQGVAVNTWVTTTIRFKLEK